jgi:acetylornithine/succinyldiaminopimelate/putrescine aminotransferase
VAEPIQGEAGAIVPPDDYWPRLREICTRHRVLLIADEVQTGMGRTGKMFGVEHWDVAPDVLCLGKALGGGVMPLSAFLSTPEIWKVLETNPFIHSSTFGGNPLACAAGIAAVNVTLEEDLPGQAAATGEYFLGELRRLQKLSGACRRRGLDLDRLEFIDRVRPPYAGCSARRAGGGTPQRQDASHRAGVEHPASAGRRGAPEARRHTGGADGLRRPLP